MVEVQGSHKRNSKNP